MILFAPCYISVQGSFTSNTDPTVEQNRILAQILPQLDPFVGNFDSGSGQTDPEKIRPTMI